MLGEPAHDVTSVIFGVDVIVDSAQACAAAWRTVLDSFLRIYSAVHETRFCPFTVPADYLRYMCGKPRSAGLRDFLASRDIRLPYDDLRGLSASQEEFFLGEVRRHGLRPFASTIAVARELHRNGVHTAVVSVHRDGTEMLRRAGVAELFDVVMDGLDASGTALPECPNAQLYLQVARRLGVSPGHAAVIEASAAGVAAARAGGFGAVVGVDRAGTATALRDHGASPVITDLAELRLSSAPVA
ncbi:MAG TPA: HAD family hydrolase [Actinoallomurus sp.]|nr:HAD family hydrolase [Actinoallomurus sp.]